MENNELTTLPQADGESDSQRLNVKEALIYSVRPELVEGCVF